MEHILHVNIITQWAAKVLEYRHFSVPVQRLFKSFKHFEWRPLSMLQSPDAD